jgi:hypothetical protein
LIYGSVEHSRLSSVLTAIGSSQSVVVLPQHVTVQSQGTVGAFEGATGTCGDGSAMIVTDSNMLTQRRRSQSPSRRTVVGPVDVQASSAVTGAAMSVALVALAGLKNRSEECFGVSLARNGPGAIQPSSTCSFPRTFFDVLLTWGRCRFLLWGFVPTPTHTLTSCALLSANTARAPGVSNLVSALQGLAAATSHIQECMSIAPQLGNDTDIISALNALEALAGIFRQYLPASQPLVHETKGDLSVSTSDGVISLLLYHSCLCCRFTVPFWLSRRGISRSCHNHGFVCATGLWSQWFMA